MEFLRYNGKCEKCGAMFTIDVRTDYFSLAEEYKILCFICGKEQILLSCEFTGEIGGF